MTARNVVNYKSRHQSRQEKVKDKVYSEVLPAEECPELLLDLLRVKTPHKHEKDIAFLFPKKGKTTDKVGNLIYFIGTTKTHKTMFSCHMDTVHRTPGTIKILYEYTNNNEETGRLFGAEDKPKDAGKSYTRSILGADDKVGCFIMLKMMEQKIPGVYVFHVGEERGGIGSKYISGFPPKWLAHIERCIAFDRKGYQDVITHQGGRRCCSDVFAKDLADKLNKNINLPKSQFKPDSTGMFTDSANYTHLIPECTNLSVGYFDQHSEYEHTDVFWLMDFFLPAVLKVEWSKLKTSRKPEPKPTYSYNPPNYASGVHGYRKPCWAGINLSTEFTKIPKWSVLDEIPPAATDTALLAAVVKAMVFDGLQGFGESVVALVKKHQNLEKALAETLKETTSIAQDLNEQLTENMELLQVIEDLCEKHGEDAESVIESMPIVLQEEKENARG